MPQVSSSVPAIQLSSTPETVQNIELPYGGARYRVIASKDISSLEDARSLCKSIGTDLGVVESNGFTTLGQRLSIPAAGGPKGKVIIGSYNGDRYGVNGAQCLLMGAGEQGIFTGECRIADAVLCQGI